MNAMFARLTKAQRYEKIQEIQQASWAALRAYFTGYGALPRTIKFGKRLMINMVFWPTILMGFGIAAFIVNIFAGPDHQYFLQTLRAILVHYPLSRVDASGISMLVLYTQLIVPIGLTVAIIVSFRPIVDQAQRTVVEKWKGTAAGRFPTTTVNPECIGQLRELMSCGKVLRSEESASASRSHVV
jgi:hypothetical protein